ncbi:hypothetical protein WS71_20465 [Burkholderia mayonis]|uniref:Uncharacterized protein n=1 Tax=Burkholderia mayonis TaxID=1385591 RepID=A0A1B4G184_9BURK|nr:hypothetical protein WS71_20465 [Burkholderia mayonis]KVE52301.1 hypothetical protein WS71_10290 [Burkholderia mayonis]
MTTSPSIRTATPTIKQKDAHRPHVSHAARTAKLRPRALPVDHRGLKSGIIATPDASPGPAHARADTRPPRDAAAALTAAATPRIHRALDGRCAAATPPAVAG